MHYKFTYRVLFRDVDAAGIVFYPRYGEFINTMVEYWMDDLGMSLSSMLKQGLGFPAVEFKIQYIAPCYLGEHLEMHAEVIHLGTSSIKSSVKGYVDSELRFTAELSSVFVSFKKNNLEATPIPDELREKILAYAQD